MALPSVILDIGQSVMQAAIDTTLPTHRQFQVRYSTQRYCPRWHYYATKYPITEGQRDLRSECILESGKVVHSAVQQRMLAMNARDDFRFLGYIDNDTGQYIEFEFNDPNRPPGHSDGLCWYKGYYGVFELKTCYEGKLEQLDAPLVENLCQVNCYANEFREKGYDISFVWVVYLERNHFSRFKDFILEPNFAMAQNYISLVNYGKQCIEMDVLPDGICYSHPKEWNYCPYVERCFEDRNPLNLNQPDFIKLVDLIYPSKAIPLGKGLQKWTR